MAIDYTSIDEVVNDFQLMVDDASYDKEAKIYQLRLLALQGLRELKFDAEQEIKATTISVSSNLRASLPSDYVKMVKIGFIGTDGVVHPLGINPNLSLDASVESQVGDSSYDENNPYYHTDIGKKFGTGGGNNENGYYRLNKDNNTISFSSGLSGKSVYLEYISDGISDIQATDHVISVAFNDGLEAGGAIGNGSTVTVPSSTGGSSEYTFTTSTPTSPYEIYIEEGWTGDQIATAFADAVNDGYPELGIDPVTDDLNATSGDGSNTVDLSYTGEDGEEIDSLSEDDYTENIVPTEEEPPSSDSEMFLGNQVGTSYGGGTIYYVYNASDPGTEITGTNEGDSALIIANENLEIDGVSQFAWGNYDTIPGLDILTGIVFSDTTVHGDIDNDGMEHQLILQHQNSEAFTSVWDGGTTAAQAADQYSTGGFNDWFLPNWSQWRRLWNKLPHYDAGDANISVNISGATGFEPSSPIDSEYWTSNDAGFAFSGGDGIARGAYLAPHPLVSPFNTQSISFDKISTRYVRPIRQVYLGDNEGGRRNLNRSTTNGVLLEQSLIQLGVPGRGARVHKFCEEALRCYIYYKYIQRKRGVPANEKQMAKRAFYNEKRLARARMMSFNKSEAMQTSRKGFKQSPKL